MTQTKIEKRLEEAKNMKSLASALRNPRIPGGVTTDQALACIAQAIAVLLEQMP